MQSTSPVPREAVLIVNAHSRKGERLFEKARNLLTGAGIRLIAAHAVRDPAGLTKLVQDSAADGAPMLIVGGGDGSLSSAVDYLIDHDSVFALLPLGTANSFARTLGIPLDLEGAVATIADGQLRKIDLGVIDGDYFANCAAIGLSSMIGDSVPHRLKKYLGRVGYLLWAIWCLMRFRSFVLVVEDEHNTHELRALEVRIANGRFHGGVEVVESSDVDSGEIVVQAVTGHVRRRLIWNWFATWFRLPARRLTTTEYRGRRLKIVTRPPMSISIDGEVQARTPVTAEVARKAITVVVPQDPPRSPLRR